MTARDLPHFSVEQYLELERAAEYKSEYYGGEIFAMSGGTYPHSILIANVTGEVHAALRGKACRVASSDLRVRTRPGGLHTYPDLTVICGEPRFADDLADTLLNPALIVEVLSKSTEQHDRGLKFEEYRMIETLREYVLVSQYRPFVEVFSRETDGSWRLREYKGLEAVCEFPALGCSVKLADLYAGVPLNAE
jgi:Uma2 family endonuclease